MRITQEQSTVSNNPAMAVQYLIAKTLRSSAPPVGPTDQNPPIVQARVGATPEQAHSTAHDESILSRMKSQLNTSDHVDNSDTNQQVSVDKLPVNQQVIADCSDSIGKRKPFENWQNDTSNPPPGSLETSGPVLVSSTLNNPNQKNYSVFGNPPPVEIDTKNPGNVRKVSDIPEDIDSEVLKYANKAEITPKPKSKNKPKSKPNVEKVSKPVIKIKPKLKVKLKPKVKAK